MKKQRISINDLVLLRLLCVAAFVEMSLLIFKKNIIQKIKVELQHLLREFRNDIFFPFY